MSDRLTNQVCVRLTANHNRRYRDDQFLNHYGAVAVF